MNPKNRWILVVLPLLLAAGLVGCTESLPATSAPTAPTESSAVVASSEPAAVVITATVVLNADEAGDPAAASVQETAAATPASPADNPIPAEPSGGQPGLPPEQVRDLALSHLGAGYQMDMGDATAFTPANLTLDAEGYTVQAGFSQGPWQVLVLAAQTSGGRTVTPVVVANTESEVRWWGEVGNDKLVTTTVSARLPRPPSRDVSGWVGTLVKLPPGSPYDDYFEGLKGNRYGIESTIADVQTLLDSLTDYEGRIQVTGELQYALPDYNGRRLAVSRVELLDAPSPQQQETQDAVAPDAGADLEPVPADISSGALTMPLPGAVLNGTVDVAGDATGLFENTVIVQVETAEGALLGRTALVTDAAEMGQGGRFAGSVPFQNPNAPGKGRVAIYSASPVDGGLELLSWVNIQLAGPATGKSAVITSPPANLDVRDRVSVNGTASGLNDQTLVVRVEDTAGTVFGQKRAKVIADTSESGLWSAEFDLRSPRTARPGRIVVYLIEPDGALSPLTTVSINLLR